MNVMNTQLETSRSPSCDSFEEIILSSLDRSIGEDQAVQLALHLDSCAFCRSFQARQIALDAALQRAMERPILALEFKQQLIALPMRATVEAARLAEAERVSMRIAWRRHLLTELLPQGLDRLACGLAAAGIIWLVADIVDWNAVAVFATAAREYIGVISLVMGGVAMAAGMVMGLRERLLAWADWW